MIKSFVGGLALVCAGALSAVAADSPQPPGLAWHFTGTDALRSSNPEAVLNQIGARQKSDFLAGQLRGMATTRLPAFLGLSSTALSADVLSPLVADLFRAESAVRLEGDRPGAGDWVLAVRLEPAGASRWESALLTIGRRLTLGEPQPLKLSGLSGWRIPGRDAQRGYSFVSREGWFLAASNFEHSVARAWAEALAGSGRPLPKLGDGAWLTLETAPAWFNWRASLPFAGRVQHVAATFGWQGQDVRTTASLTPAASVSKPAGAWRIPKGIVQDPLISFTGVRNLKSFFSELAVMKGLAADAIPDQWFGWSLGSVAFINDFAVPLTDAGALFAHLDRSVPATYNPPLLEIALGQWLTVTNQTTGQPRLVWRGLPVFVPYLGPEKDGDRDFLQGGVFPLQRPTNAPPAPAELWAQFENRDDLIYYDWEITLPRLSAFEQMKPFTSLFLPLAEPLPATHAIGWMQEIQSTLTNNVVTEITVSGPKELSLTRRSQIGLTGIELWLLAHWLDSKDFPKFPYGRPKRPEAGKLPEALPGSPVGGNSPP